MKNEDFLSKLSKEDREMVEKYKKKIKETEIRLAAKKESTEQIAKPNIVTQKNEEGSLPEKSENVIAEGSIAEDPNYKDQINRLNAVILNPTEREEAKEEVQKKIDQKIKNKFEANYYDNELESPELSAGNAINFPLSTKNQKEDDEKNNEESNNAEPIPHFTQNEFNMKSDENEGNIKQGINIPQEEEPIYEQKKKYEDVSEETSQDILQQLQKQEIAQDSSQNIRADTSNNLEQEFAQETTEKKNQTTKITKTRERISSEEGKKTVIKTKKEIHTEKKNLKESKK